MTLFLYDSRSICLLAFLLLKQYKTIDDKYPHSISKDSFFVNHPSYLLNKTHPADNSYKKKTNQQVSKCAVKNTQPTAADALLTRFTNVRIKSKQDVCYQIAQNINTGTVIVSAFAGTVSLVNAIVWSAKSRTTYVPARSARLIHGDNCWWKRCHRSILSI
jgi:hypothetical protein